MTIDTYVYLETPAAEAGAPLVLTFHGTGGDEHQFHDFAGDLWPGAGILSPRGDVSEYGALRYFRRKAEGVYDMADLEKRTRKMAGFIAAHKKRSAPNRVVGLGYSNGANILAAVVFQHASLFDDIVLTHPLIPWQPAANAGLAQLRVLITAGRHDPICPPTSTVALNDYFLRQGVRTVLDWHEGGHEIQPSEQSAIGTCNGWARHAVPDLTFDRLMRLARAVASASAQVIDETRPLLSATLPGDERIQIVIPPAVTRGTVSVTIRKPSSVTLSLPDLARDGLFCDVRPASVVPGADAELMQLYERGAHAEFLARAVEARKNILISGATSSGKTTIARQSDAALFGALLSW